MATTPIIKPSSSSSARKLPITRKSSSSSNTLTTITPPSDDALVAAVASHDKPDHVNDEFDDEEENEDEEEEEEQADDLKSTPPATSHQPFKFHRIWSESDEIRFLQGLLGCYSQNMVFPRDLNLRGGPKGGPVEATVPPKIGPYYKNFLVPPLLNLFYDRFSESMPQPFTRSQLSEKLRRLRKKYRLMSSRVARGHSIVPHDRDLLHLCTRLWHPNHAASSPFSATASPAAPTASRNKRSRRCADPPARSEEQFPLMDVKIVTASAQHKEQYPLPVIAKIVKQKEGSDCKIVAKVILEVFDASLNDLRMTLVRHRLLCRGGRPSEASAGDLERKWKEQRAAEVDALAQRLRLILENAVQS